MHSRMVISLFCLFFLCTLAFWNLKLLIFLCIVHCTCSMLLQILANHVFFCMCRNSFALSICSNKINKPKKKIFHNVANICRRWVCFSLAVLAIETGGKSNTVTVTIDFTLFFLKTQFSFHLLELLICRKAQNSN